MARTVLLGDPTFFRVKSGSNPHTRDRFGRRKKVDPDRAMEQWCRLKWLLEGHGVRVEVLPPDPELPGLVFPANAGFRHGRCFYLSNLNPARAGETAHYQRKISGLGLEVRRMPAAHSFEGEADFIPTGDLFLFTYGQLEQPHWKFRLGFPPDRRVYGFRSDYQMLPALRAIVHPKEVLLLELTDERHYHGDTILCVFGPRNEHLMVYLEGLATEGAQALKARFGERLLPLSREDGAGFAANSFQIETDYHGRRVPLLLMPDGLSQGLYEQVRARGVIPLPVDVSEFLGKGGGAVKCMLLDLGEL
jgi:N-dimethylarginine dimethylaminohydrolase